jgi:arginase family enzyme
VVPAAEVRRRGPEQILAALSATIPCYISIDIDVLDPCYAPGTGTPMPGGLKPEELKDLLRVIGKRSEVVGMDLVEVNTSRDPGTLTSILACHMITVGLGAFMPRRMSRQISPLQT